MAIKGERFGDFVLAARVGAGIAGEVWKAKGPSGDLVAVKIYTDSNYAAIVRDAGLPEPPLRHRHIAGVLQADLGARRPFIVSELVQGYAVREIMRERGYVPVGAAMSVVLQVVKALAHAHSLGHAHWNLRPENILLDRDGLVKVTDFHAAEARKRLIPKLLARADTDQAGPGQGVSSQLLPYMPPEQRRGVWEGVEADAYALGVSLYEMTTGKLPEELDVALRYPSRVDHRIPKVVDEICIRCMERQPRARFHDMEQLEAILMVGLDKGGFVVDTSGPPNTWVRRRQEGEEPAPGQETGRFAAFLKKLVRRD